MSARRRAVTRGRETGSGGEGACAVLHPWPTPEAAPVGRQLVRTHDTHCQCSAHGPASLATTNRHMTKLKQGCKNERSEERLTTARGAQCRLREGGPAPPRPAGRAWSRREHQRLCRSRLQLPPHQPRNAWSGCCPPGHTEAPGSRRSPPGHAEALQVTPKPPGSRRSPRGHIEAPGSCRRPRSLGFVRGPSRGTRR